MRRNLPLSLAALAAAAALIPAAAQADGVKRTAAGATPADITAAVNAFRADIGGANNAGGPAAAVRPPRDQLGRRARLATPIPIRSPAAPSSAAGSYSTRPAPASRCQRQRGQPDRDAGALRQPRVPGLLGRRGSSRRPARTLYDSHFFVPGTAHAGHHAAPSASSSPTSTSPARRRSSTSIPTGAAARHRRRPRLAQRRPLLRRRVVQRRRAHRRACA